MNKIKKNTLSVLLLGSVLFAPSLMLAEDMDITIDGYTVHTNDTAAGDVYGDVEYDNVTIHIKDISYDNGKGLSIWAYNRYGYFGGGNLMSGATLTYDSLDLYFDGGKISSIHGGSFLGNGTFTVTDGINIEVSGGEVVYAVTGGSISGTDGTSNSDQGTQKGYSYIYGGSTIIISGDAKIGSDTNVFSNYDYSLYSLFDLAGSANGVLIGSVYGGGSMANQSYETIDYTNVTIKDNAVVNGIVVAGGSTHASSQLTITGSTDQLYSTQVTIQDNATINGGYVIGGLVQTKGSYANTYVSVIYGDTLVSIEGGTIADSTGYGAVFGGSLSGGSYSSDSASTSSISYNEIKGNTNVIVSGGTNENLDVFGGGYSCGFGESYAGWDDNYQTIYGDTNVSIEGGTVGNVYGGSAVYGDYMFNVITGNTNIDISGGTITGDVFAGGRFDDSIYASTSSSVVEGDAYVNITNNVVLTGLVSGQGENGAIVEGTSTLNMGTAELAYTGSLNNVADFDTINVASGSNATVNGTISSSDALNISGDLTVNSTVYVDSITIAEYASLTVNISESTTFTNEAMTFSNSGTLNLYASLEATAGSTYTVFANGEVDIANFVTFGGTYSSNKFTVGTTDTSLSLETSGEITILGGDRVIVATSESNTSTAVYMAFSSNSSATVKAVTDISSNEDLNQSFIAQYTSDIETSSETLLASAAYDFDIDITSGSVLLSMYVGVEYFDVSQFTIYHLENDGSNWDTTSVSNVSYDGEYVSFEVTGFSTYGYTVTAATAAVPEPSTYAMIIGVLALGFAAYRRRK